MLMRYAAVYTAVPVCVRFRPFKVHVPFDRGTDDTPRLRPGNTMLVGFHKFVRYVRARRARACTSQQQQGGRKKYSTTRARARTRHRAPRARGHIFSLRHPCCAVGTTQLRTATIFSRSEKGGLLDDVPIRQSAGFRTRRNCVVNGSWLCGA
jgi:hypothetical protein